MSFDPVEFYRSFPVGGPEWLRRCLEAMLRAAQAEA